MSKPDKFVAKPQHGDQKSVPSDRGDGSSSSAVKLEPAEETTASTSQQQQSSQEELYLPTTELLASAGDEADEVPTVAVAQSADESSDEERRSLRIAIRTSESEDYGSSMDSDAEAFPTTITSMLATGEDSNEEAVEADCGPGDETLIPTTFDVDDDTEARNYPETSVADFNSFWKYKKLPKGPKVRQKFQLDMPALNDPHKPLVFSDPVFDKSQRNKVVHYGKVRVGEGNDITPNPKKLVELGKDIQILNAQMASLSNTSTDKKEKMKLSSRICRMKRSANHEANKIKFAGLEQEREELCKVIREKKRARTSEEASSSNLSAQIYQTKVAGRTSEYVNSVLEGAKLPGTSSYLDSSDSESD